MDGPSLAVLEYPLIVERLAEATVTPQGGALARGLVPSPDTDEVASRQARTAEAVGLLGTGRAPSLHGVVDVRAEAARAERGGSLTAAELRAIANTVSGSPGRARHARRAARIGPAPRCRRGRGRAGTRRDRRRPRPARRGRRLRTPRHGLAAAPAAAERAARRPAARRRRAVTAGPVARAARAPAGDVRHRPRRPAGAGRQGERPLAGARDRPRRVELGPDAVRRAARRRRARQPTGRDGERRA